MAAPLHLDVRVVGVGAIVAAARDDAQGDTGTMICANCHEPTQSDEACTACGDEPILQGRYRLDEVLGAGASGTTFRATDLASGNFVAIKELDWRKLDAFKTEELFEREAETMRQLDHPGIPDYIETFTESSGRHVAAYLVQEFIDGKTLEQERAVRRHTVADVLEIAEEILEIVAYLHALVPPVVHRDIKPKNVMRRRAGDLVLIDFGSVRSVVKPEGGSTVAGTIGYMAPEQLAGLAAPASDIYGVGALMVALMTSSDPHEILGPGRSDAWRDALPANVEPEVRELLGMMLEDNPDERVGGARFVQQWIRDLRSGAPVKNDWSGVGSTTSKTPRPAPKVAKDLFRSEPLEPDDSSSSIKASIILLVASVVIVFVVGFILASDSPTPVDVTYEPPPGPRVDPESVGELGQFAQIGMPMSDLEQLTEATNETHVRRGRLVFARVWWDCTFAGDELGDPAPLVEVTCISEPLAPRGLLSSSGVIKFATAKYDSPARLPDGGATWTSDDIQMTIQPVEGERLSLHISTEN